ncbi:MAG: hypothetical protein V7717_08700 [Porticoccaceae bacterium]
MKPVCLVVDAGAGVGGTVARGFYFEAFSEHGILHGIRRMMLFNFFKIKKIKCLISALVGAI